MDFSRYYVTSNFINDIIGCIESGCIFSCDIKFSRLKVTFLFIRKNNILSLLSS